MSSIPTMFSRSQDGDISGVTFILGTQPYMADASLPTFDELIEELKSATPDEARLVALTEPATAIIDAVAAAEEADYLPKGKVSVSRSEVRYNDEVLEGVLIDRILQMLAEGFDIMPMIRFLENLYLNPGQWSRDELYLWLEKSNLPITEDGYFLAYKRVNGNFTSIHDSRTDNTPGTEVSIPRSKVDTERAHECSTGLHFCSIGYLLNGPGQFGAGYSNSASSKIVMLKINPADVVSIPGDYGNTKGRAWKYLVLSTVMEDPTGKKWAAVVDSNGEDFEDDEDDVDPWDDDDVEEDETEDLLTFPSDLAGALFASLTEIGIDTSDRDARLEWANDNLSWHETEISSFKELTTDQASRLLDIARDEKAEQDEEAEQLADEAQEEADQAAAAAKQAKIDAINSYGIVKLRKLTGKWKGFKAADLRAELIAAL